MLKNVESGCNRMLQDFGAPAFDLIGQLSAPHPQRDDFEFSFQKLTAGIRTQSLDDTLKIARFMMCDRPDDQFDQSLTEQAFQDYVRANFWNESTKEGGWDYQLLVCLVTRQAS